MQTKRGSACARTLVRHIIRVARPTRAELCNLHTRRMEMRRFPCAGMKLQTRVSHSSSSLDDSAVTVVQQTIVPYRE